MTEDELKEQEQKAVAVEAKKQLANNNAKEAKAKLQACPKYQTAQWLQGVNSLIANCEKDCIQASSLPAPY